MASKASRRVDLSRHCSSASPSRGGSADSALVSDDLASPERSDTESESAVRRRFGSARTTGAVRGAGLGPAWPRLSGLGAGDGTAPFGVSPRAARGSRALLRFPVPRNARHGRGTARCPTMPRLPRPDKGGASAAVPLHPYRLSSCSRLLKQK